MSLSLPTQDPHSSMPSRASPCAQSRLSFARPGLDLEIGWLPSLCKRRSQSQDRDGRKRLSRLLRASSPCSVPSSQVSRAQGDIHRGGNPHYLYDPRNGAKVARGSRSA
jgi:zinc/manganese transport system substrate-binding protein